jgi:hypothetical protein
MENSGGPTSALDAPTLSTMISAMRSPTPSTHVPELDGLRGFLASWVCLIHLLTLCGITNFPLPHLAAVLWNQFIFGGPAVEVFIILSGFAITSLLHRKQPSYLDFVRERFFRLYPVYLICLLSGLVWIHPSTTRLQALVFMAAIGLPVIGLLTFLLHGRVEAPRHEMGQTKVLLQAADRRTNLKSHVRSASGNQRP